MPTPSLTLWFRRILDPMPAYGSTYEDVSRPGIDGHRFRYIGRRGKPVTVTGVRFYLDIATANTAKTALEGYQGREAYLQDGSNNQVWHVFILGITCEAPQAVVCTLPNIGARLVARLDVIRMA